MEPILETTSQPKHFLFELEDQEATIPEGKLEYLRARTRNNLYAYIIRKFWEQEAKSGLTKAKLARRIDCDPGRLNKLLGAPGNWTIATVSDLLVGIAAEELDPRSEPILGRGRRNYTGPTWLEQSATASSVSTIMRADDDNSTITSGNESGATIQFRPSQ